MNLNVNPTNDIVFAFFAAKRYWSDDTVLENAYKDLVSALPFPANNTVLVTDGETALPQGKCLVAVPMSGAVQKNILAASEKFDHAILYAAYIKGNASDAVTTEMCRCNAAPTVMDCWGVLKRTHPHAELALNARSLAKAVQLISAYSAIRSAKLLQIGVTEPWVISNSSKLSTYEERFGLTIEHVEQAELAEMYQSCSDEDASFYLKHFRDAAIAIREPSETDLLNACRMACALMKLLKKYNADGVAMACFNLLELGTTSCLGVSYVNECTDMVAACECDMDSAITMLFMKKLTNTKLWMANPGLQPDGTVNFSHCTAPICIREEETLPFTLRNHHESGIGAALQVEIPVGETVTACRISDEARSITVHRAVTIEGPYEPVCRTQAHIRFDDPEHYLQTALGCHQIFAFEDIADQLKKLAKMFGLQLL